MGEINYETEKCWHIKSGKTPFPVRVEGYKICFDAMTISYSDYEDLRSKIDYARVYLPNGIRVYDWARKNNCDKNLPDRIDGFKVLHGSSSSSYSYENGKCEISFRDNEECMEHAKRLALEGLIFNPVCLDIPKNIVLFHRGANAWVKTLESCKPNAAAITVQKFGENEETMVSPQTLLLPADSSYLAGKPVPAKPSVDEFGTLKSWHQTVNDVVAFSKDMRHAANEMGQKHEEYLNSIKQEDPYIKVCKLADNSILTPEFGYITVVSDQWLCIIKQRPGESMTGKVPEGLKYPLSDLIITSNNSKLQGKALLDIGNKVKITYRAGKEPSQSKALVDVDERREKYQLGRDRASHEQGK